MGSYPSGANGFARVDPRRPIAFAICDRCGQRYNKTDLVWQFEWQGSTLQNTRFLVCKRKCLDVPNEQLRSYSPPADPLPVRDPRPDQSYMGNGPTVIYTVGGSSQILIPANPAGDLVNFAIPASFGIWLNVTGGQCGPGLPDCSFYAPGSYFEVWGQTSAITYYSNVSGLQLVVQTQSSATIPFPQPITPVPPPVEYGNLINNGQFLFVTNDVGWNTSGAAGTFTYNSGYVCYEPIAYDPSLAPLFFGISVPNLLLANAAALSPVPGLSGSGLLWANDGFVGIS